MISIILAFLKSKYDSVNNSLRANNLSLGHLKQYFSSNILNYRFAFCCVIVFFYILPFIIANVPYKDDYQRLLNPHYYWYVDGRFVTNFLYKFFSLRFSQATFAPWGLIVGSFALCASAFLFLRKFNVKSGLVSSIAIIYLFSSPFLLQPLSYHFDPLAMLFAAVFCIWIFIVPGRNVFAVFFSVFILTFFCLLTYPTVIAAIPILALVELIVFVKNDENPKDILKLLFTRFLAFFISVAAWYFTNYQNYKFVNKDIAHSENVFAALLGKIQSIFGYIKGWHVYSDFVWIMLGVMFAIFCVVMFVFALKVFSKKTVWHRICAGTIVLSPFIIFFMGLFGVNAVQNFAMNPRYFIPFSISLFALMFLLLTFSSKKLRFIVLFLSIFPLIYSFGLVYSYGNALRFNYESNRIIAASLMSTINSDTALVTFKGSSQRAATLSSIFKAYPYVKRLLRADTFRDNNPQQNWLLLRHFGLNVKLQYTWSEEDKQKSKEALQNLNKAELIAKHYYYNLLQYGGMYIIDFDKTEFDKK